MAKRYARINWQNRPNVATPISATNLNKMDKGIDDIDKALDALETSIVGQIVNDPSKINNAAVIFSLSNQVTELNNNLFNLRLPINDMATDTEIETFLQELHSSATNMSWYRSSLSVNATGLSLSGGTWYVEGFKVTALHGWQKVIKYAPNDVLLYYRSLYSSTWSSWITK